MTFGLEWAAVAEGAWFGSRLKKLMDGRGLSQRELARRSGVSYSLLNKILNDKRHEPRYATKERLARPLGLSVADLEGPGRAKGDWRADLMADTTISPVTRQTILTLLEAEEARLLQRRRK